MNILFTPAAWEDYLYWQTTNQAAFRKLNELIKVIQREPYQGIGKPEPLKWELQGCWSRRLSHEHRIVYRIEKRVLQILSCRYHY